MSVAAASNMIGTISGTVGAVGGKLSEGVCHLCSDRAKIKANLFAGTGEMVRNGNVSEPDVNLIKTYINDPVVDEIYKEQLKLIIESDIPYEEKIEQLEGLKLNRQITKNEQVNRADGFSSKKHFRAASYYAFYLVGVLGLVVVSKKFKLF